MFDPSRLTASERRAYNAAVYAITHPSAERSTGSAVQTIEYLREKASK